MEAQMLRFLENQMGFLRSMDERQMDFLRSIKEDQTTFFTSMKNLQSSRDERQTGLLASIDQRLAKLNPSDLQNKLEDEDSMKKEKGEQKVTKKEEVMCDSYQGKQLHEFPAPGLSSSRTEEKKYRLHIVMDKGCHENERSKMSVIEGEPIRNLEVILKYGDEPVPASDPLASLRVELVVLDANYYIEDSIDWPRKEFESHLMTVPNKSRSSTRMTVERGIFSLVGGRKVHSAASIKQSSGKKKVRLGVMVVDDGSVQERVLEGVSSNEFSVIHRPRPVIHKLRPGATCAEKKSKRETTGNSELNTNGKRAINNIYDATLQPSTSSNLQFSGHVQTAQKFGQHATGEQPSPARNVCLTQNRPTPPIDAGNIGRAVPPAYAPNSYQGLPALVHKNLDENLGIPSEEAYGFMHNPPDNQGHVDLSSQNLMMENGADDKGARESSESPGDDDVIPLLRESSDSMLYYDEHTFFSLTGDGPVSPLLGMPPFESRPDCAEMQLREWPED